MAEYVKVWWTVDQTPEEHYWAEKIRAELDDNGCWHGGNSPSDAHRRVLDRAILLGDIRG